MAQATSRIVGEIGILAPTSIGPCATTTSGRFAVLFVAGYCISLSLFSALTFLDVGPIGPS